MWITIKIQQYRELKNLKYILSQKYAELQELADEQWKASQKIERRVNCNGVQCLMPPKKIYTEHMTTHALLPTMLIPQDIRFPALGLQFQKNKHLNVVIIKKQLRNTYLLETNLAQTQIADSIKKTLPPRMHLKKPASQPKTTIPQNQTIKMPATHFMVNTCRAYFVKKLSYLFFPICFYMQNMIKLSI